MTIRLFMKMILLCAVLTSLINLTLAQDFSTERKLITPKYMPNTIVTILTAPNFVTHVELEHGEKLTIDPALGDSEQWQVEHHEQHIFIKPDAADLKTNLTLVSNRRTYLLNLISSPVGGFFYQGVKFRYGAPMVKRVDAEFNTKNVEQRTGEKNENTSAVDIHRLNSRYQVEGQAAFRPEFVQDDGQFTYIKFPNSLREYPSLFIRRNEQLQMVNYTVHPTSMVTKVAQIADEIILKLDREQVSIRNLIHK